MDNAGSYRRCIVCSSTLQSFQPHFTSHMLVSAAGGYRRLLDIFITRYTFYTSENSIYLVTERILGIISNLHAHFQKQPSLKVTNENVKNFSVLFDRVRRRRKSLVHKRSILSGQKPGLQISVGAETGIHAYLNLESR
jgi:hypothetical protein